MPTFTIDCTHTSEIGFTLTDMEVWQVAQFTTLHTTDVADLASATLTYIDGSVVTVTRNDPDKDES